MGWKVICRAARVMRLNILDSVGRHAARRFGVRAVPAFLVVDGQGNVVDAQSDKKHATAGRVFALEPPSRLELETRRLRSGCSTD
jgi:hypothetical protein